MNDIWQLIIQTNTLNFIIVLVVLILIFSKLNIKQNLENISNEIKSYVNDSSYEKSNAEKDLAEIKNKILELPKEIEQIELSTVNSINSLEKNAESEIKEKIVDIDNSVKRIMNLETKKFKSKLTAILSEASVVLAKENALKQLENNRELHNKYIDDAIEEIDRINL